MGKTCTNQQFQKTEAHTTIVTNNLKVGDCYSIEAKRKINQKVANSVVVVVIVVVGMFRQQTSVILTDISSPGVRHRVLKDRNLVNKRVDSYISGLL